MSVVKFSSARKVPAAQAEQVVKELLLPGNLGNKVLMVLLSAVWVVTVLTWPLLKWLVSIDVALQFFRMLYHWNTAGAHAGWTFVLHFGVLFALTCFVAFYKPKWL
jgi:hypothetical protein